VPAPALAALLRLVGGRKGCQGPEGTPLGMGCKKGQAGVLWVCGWRMSVMLGRLSCLLARDLWSAPHARLPGCALCLQDLKSPNILCDERWRVKITDFGLSKARARTFITATAQGGTPGARQRLAGATCSRRRSAAAALPTCGRPLAACRVDGARGAALRGHHRGRGCILLRRVLVVSHRPAASPAPRLYACQGSYCL